MNIFEKITAKSLRKNRSRTVVTLIGVMLSVAMITGVIAFAASLRSYTIEGAKETMGDWYAMVKPITKAQQEALTGAEGLQRIGTYEEIGYGAYLGEGEGLPKSVLVAGYDEALLEMQKVKLTSGALPQTEREVILPIDFQDEHRKTFAPGETLELKVGGETKVYTITGIYTKPKNYGNNTQDKYAAITVQTQKNSERIVAFITTEKAKNIQEFVQENFPDKAVKYNRGLLQFMSITGGGFFVTFTTFLSGFLILLIIFGSALLIYNNFSLSVEGKLKEFGILSSIGATRHQIRLAVLYEGLYFSMIAIPTGVLLGLLGTEITFYLLRGNFDDIIENGISTRLSLDISFALILLAVGISFATIMVSAWIPAAKGSRRSAVEAIFRREESELIQKQGKFSSLFSQRLSFPGFLALKNFRKNSKKYRATTLSLFLSIILFVMASTVGHYFVKTMNGVYGHEEGYQITFSEFQEKGLIQDQNYKALSEAKGILSAT
ncbi:MAG: FtsX-like permease family protein, partial [Anaerovoracaceae bacterium]